MSGKRSRDQENESDRLLRELCTRDQQQQLQQFHQILDSRYPHARRYFAGPEEDLAERPTPTVQGDCTNGSSSIPSSASASASPELTRAKKSRLDDGDNNKPKQNERRDDPFNSILHPYVAQRQQQQQQRAFPAFQPPHASQFNLANPHAIDAMRYFAREEVEREASTVQGMRNIIDRVNNRANNYFNHGNIFGPQERCSDEVQEDRSIPSPNNTKNEEEQDEDGDFLLAIALSLSEEERQKQQQQQRLQLQQQQQQPQTAATASTIRHKEQEQETATATATTETETAAEKQEPKQNQKNQQQQQQQKELRFALVIGNAKYQHYGALDNPTNDADAMATTLEDLGFKVTQVKDATLQVMKQKLDAFHQQRRGAIRDLENNNNNNNSNNNAHTVGLLFYSGHGHEFHGINYLLPIDSPDEFKNEIDLKLHAINLNEQLNLMKECDSSGVNILILDTCSDEPRWASEEKLRGSRSLRDRRFGPLKEWNTPPQTYVMFSSDTGENATDGDPRDRNSMHNVYVTELLKHMPLPGVPITEMAQNVRKAVMQATNNKQKPHDKTSLIDHFFFKHA